jgi:hypothetical protein
MNRKLSAVGSAAAIAVALTGCGLIGNDSDGVAIPPSYYQMVGGVPQCYFVDSVGEVTALEAAGLCPPNSEPAVMPGDWEAAYYPYYVSSAYYGRYVPVARRTTYVHTTTTSFGAAGVRRYTKVTVTVRHH